MSSATIQARRIWICADDYGIAPGVNAAIRDLVARGALNATSVMVLAPSFDRTEAAALDALNRERQRVAIGLHLTLTAPFRPLHPGFRPLRDGRFLSLGNCLAASHLRRFDASSLTAEVTAQLDAFVRAFGRAPDFVDGHQHVHLFPQIRDAVLRRVASAVPGAWVRQCGRSGPLRRRFADRKGLLLDILSGSFRDRAARLGLATNAAFAGTYDFDAAADFASLLPTFLASLPDRGLMMCHPGIVDEQLQRLDPLTGLREREYAVLAGAALPRLLASCGVTLM